MVKILALLGIVGGAFFLFPRRALASAGNNVEDIPVKSPNSSSGDTRPRGIRNNNPTNIEDSGIPWRGRIGNDGRYVVFDTPINGLRAGYLEIWDSIYRDGDDTIRTLIRQWAPPNENETSAYISSVSLQTKIDRDAKLNYARDATKILRAIVRHENGQDPYTSEQYEQAYREAGKS